MCNNIISCHAVITDKQLMNCLTRICCTCFICEMSKDNYQNPYIPVTPNATMPLNLMHFEGHLIYSKQPENCQESIFCQTSSFLPVCVMISQKRIFWHTLLQIAFLQFTISIIYWLRLILLFICRYLHIYDHLHLLSTRWQKKLIWKLLFHV